MQTFDKIDKNFLDTSRENRMHNKEIPAVYYAGQAHSRIIIDGRLDEPDWEIARPIPFFALVTNKAPASKTIAKILYDSSYLYLGFIAFDDDIRATFTERDSHTWREDVLEAFFKPLEHCQAYYEFEFSPLGTIFDAEIPDKNHLPRILECSKWNCDGLKVAATIDGTPNKPDDIDNLWTLEVAIPFAGLPVLGGRIPCPGDKWRFHLARYDYSIYLHRGRELSSCAKFTVANFHHQQDWSYLEFT